ncbi:hypothetical protein Tsubulata_001262, partial [Turnera subulata]
KKFKLQTKQRLNLPYKRKKEKKHYDFDIFHDNMIAHPKGSFKFQTPIGEGPGWSWENFIMGTLQVSLVVDSLFMVTKYI